MRMLMLFWFIPLLTILLVLMFGASTRISRQTLRTLSVSMKQATEICSLRINDCIKASRNATYLPELRDIYSEYEAGGDKNSLYNSVTLFLEEQYKFNPYFEMTVLTFNDSPDDIYYTRSESMERSGASLSELRRDIWPDIKLYAKGLDTRVGFLCAKDRMYMVRNVVDKHFEPIAIIAMELDRNEIFGSLTSVWQYQGMSVWYDDALCYTSGNTDSGYRIYEQSRIEDAYFKYGVDYDRNGAFTERRSISLAFATLLIMTIPLLYGIISFTNKRITGPISGLALASKEIAGGDFDVRVAANTDIREIDDLSVNFNLMSEKLKEQFERIFVEEIALRDANIHALQSQINPHFLNNTLEIINWETRIAGNEKVSQMIEALSTMLEATLDRSGRPLIPLREELSYVKAYIFIIRCRFGQSFEYSEETDDSIMDELVPRLVVQPVIENAVEHGADAEGKRRVFMSAGATRDVDGKVSLIEIRIVNKGVPTSGDWDKIKKLLSTEDEPGDNRSLSIGIRNVNKRLQIMYGGSSGLSITTDSEGNTVNTIRIDTSGGGVV